MSVTRHHSEWLALVPNSGPFVSLLVATQVWPQGLDAHDPEHARRLRRAYEEWDEDQAARRPDPAMHRAWIEFVLRETLGYERTLAEGQAIPQTLRSDVAEHGEMLRPDWVLVDPETKKARLLIQAWTQPQALDKQAAASRWKASPDTRMAQLLRDTGVRLGIVTNGEHWMLVNAPRNETTGYASWFASLWLEEPIALRAFRTLLSAERFFGVAGKDTIEGLLDRSASDQQEVTDQLGYQVRKAVEVLIHALDKADQDHGRRLLAGVDEKMLYEAALTVMMRLVFLFCAEERELLLLGDDLWDKNYAVSTLREQLRTAADQHGEEILGFRHDAWGRLLSTFRAVHGGVTHDRFKLPAYGGSLFDPDRFPFLEGRGIGTTWRGTEAAPLPVNNRTVLHLLEALQVLQVRLPGGGPAEARALSFRSLDIEQIGHVYEGLLDHTAVRGTEPVLGLKGTRDNEPEIALAELVRRSAKGESELVSWLNVQTGRSESAIAKALHSEVDAELASRFQTVCQDPGLWGQAASFAGLVREDSTGYPVVITPGSVFVTKGTDRRASGTHYTPKSLTEPIVQYTLEPLVYTGPAEGLPKDQWKLRSARELLELKVCDMACGSGAFLVQACRYLSARLLEAWDEVQRAHPGTLRITPEGEPSTGQPGELLIPDDPDERQTYALRIVAQRCLYGVDKNPLAAEMAKLSLWLLTLAKDKPFEFLDHAIRCGDSLLGLTEPAQIDAFDIDPGRDASKYRFKRSSADALAKAIAARRKLESFAVSDIRDAEEKERLLGEAQAAVAEARLISDLVVGASLARAGKRAVALDDLLHDLERKFRMALDGSKPAKQRDLAWSSLGNTAIEQLGLRQALHWVLEFPEVFATVGAAHGFDAVVGNPPFQGGQKITGELGTDYRDYLVQHLAGGQRGSADLCAYFFLRAAKLLRPSGMLGLLATNTIAQGDTREVGLEQIAADGCEIVRAVPSRKWPGEANLEVAHVWLRRGEWKGEHVLDEKPVTGISPFLVVPGVVQGKPYRLRENEGKSFIGSYVLGMGFVLTPEEAQSLIAKDRRNKDVLFPYLNGEDLNSRPDQSPSRWVINFHDWPIEKAEQYADCMRIVREKVKPERDMNNRKVRRERWWQFAERAPELYTTIAGLERVLVLSLVNNHLGFASVGSKQVFAHKLTVFPVDVSTFSALQSHLHYHWAWEYSSTMRKDINYSPSDCFETFPFPPAGPALAAIGETYHAHRQSIMLARLEGLTKTYNHFHDPRDTSSDIAKLRKLHVEMDHAVAAAYAWTNLDLGHGFHETRQGVRFTPSAPARREVLGRLLKLNHERYEEEVRRGLHEKQKSKGSRGRRNASSRDEQGPGLFGAT